jgi:formate dehydrogenase subunit gamma
MTEIMRSKTPSGEDMSTVESWDSGRAATIIAAHRGADGAALPVLHALQEAFGYVSEDAVRMVAEALNLSRAEVHGIVTFYHDFRHAPSGRHVLKLCRAEACQSVGGDALAAHAQARLQLGWGETTANGAVTLEPIFCLGLCACGPSALLDGKVVGRLDKARLDAIIDGVLR